MNTTEAKVLHAILSKTDRADIMAILDAEDRLSYAAAHLGINAQCEANSLIFEACDDAIESIQPYYLEKLSSELKELIK